MTDIKREIKDRPTEALKNRKDEIQLLLLYKQKCANQYKEKLMHLERSCLDLRDEYKTIDRVIFIREDRITKISGHTKKEKKQEASIKQRVEDMSAAEASELLSQLLAIQKRRQR